MESTIRILCDDIILAKLKEKFYRIPIDQQCFIVHDGAASCLGTGDCWSSARGCTCKKSPSQRQVRRIPSDAQVRWQATKRNKEWSQESLREDLSWGFQRILFYRPRIRTLLEEDKSPVCLTGSDRLEDFISCGVRESRYVLRMSILGICPSIRMRGCMKMSIRWFLGLPYKVLLKSFICYLVQRFRVGLNIRTGAKGSWDQRTQVVERLGVHFPLL